MSTKANYPISEIGKGKPGFSKTRSIIEAAFYGNNVVPVNTLKEAYNLAKNSPGTIVTDMPVYRGEEFGLDKDAKVLLFNDGAITGRYAAARRIAGEPGVDCEALGQGCYGRCLQRSLQKDCTTLPASQVLTLNSWLRFTSSFPRAKKTLCTHGCSTSSTCLTNMLRCTRSLSPSATAKSPTSTSSRTRSGLPLIIPA